MTILAKLQFELNGARRHCLLTDRGWTIIHGDGGMIALLNHICPLTDPEQAEACAARAAELLRGTVIPL
jgi:hypothetical protein